MFLSSLDRDSGWGRPNVGVTLARAEVNTYRYSVEDHNMPVAGYHSVGVEGPNARARCGVSSRGVEGMAQLSAGKITSEVGYARAELNPNLTTGVSAGSNGFDARLGGAGASINSSGIGFHTPVGSIGIRNPWKK